MNKVVLIGRLVKDGELRFTPGKGTAVVSFNIAVNRPYKQSDSQQKADFIPIVLWGKVAESLAPYLVKGKQVAVHGRIQTRDYIDKSGSKKYVTEIVSNEIELLSRNEKGGQQQHNTGGFNASGFNNVTGEDDGDIPF